MFPGFENLSVLRLTRIIQGLVDAREKPQELMFLKRATIVPAFDGEIMGRFIGRVLIADLVADDSVAGVYSSGKLTFDSYQSPNIKIGRDFTQSQIKQLQSIGGQMTGTKGENLFMDFIGPTVENALLGVRQRMEALLVAMHTNVFSYDKLGFKVSNANWRFPSDLQITPAIPWTDAANATPISDIQAAILLAKIRYGITFNRIRMSTPAFRYLIATAEFQAKAKVFIPAQLTFANLSLLDLDQQQSLLESVLKCKIEFYDSRYWSQDTAGTLASAPFLPINKVILDNPSNDNNAGVYDFSSGIVTESLFFGMPNSSVIGGSSMAINGGVRGPVSYATGSPTLNPPNLTLWAASVGWPRRHIDQMSACLTVGTFADQIAIGDPF